MSTMIVLDPSSGGRVFEGVGAVSAGASSRHLVDFPEPQRSQVLDYLFMPGFGASLQHLKVEIGGDDNSTCGSEPSHVRVREELSAPRARGYEFWLMAEARKRNPQIQLEGLPWCYPSWIKERFSQDSADWLVAFLEVARRDYGMEIDWLAAGQNELGTDLAWVADVLRPTLDRRGFGAVRLQGPDDNKDMWKVFEEFARDPHLARAVEASGYHYLSGWLPNLADDANAVTDLAKASGKSLWASEDFSCSGRTWDKALLWARLINKFYIRDRVTKVLAWCPVDSILPGVPFAGTGLMQAYESWSGHYEVWPAVWTTAHTTQFAQPGWRYVDSACGCFDPADWRGTHVGLHDPESGDWSLIVCTEEARDIEIRVVPALKRGPVRVRRSTAAEQFEEIPAPIEESGVYRMRLEAHAVYTFSTVASGNKGDHGAVPVSRPVPLPFREDFSRSELGTSPSFFSDQVGTFEVVEREDGKGRCLRQMAAGRGILWMRDYRTPYTVFGDSRWSIVAIQAAVRVVAGKVEVGGRFSRPASLDTSLTLGADGRWDLIAHADFCPGEKTPWIGESKSLASGIVPDFEPAAWQVLRIAFLQDNVRAWINGRELGWFYIPGAQSGLAYLASTWHPNSFADIVVEPT